MLPGVTTESSGWRDALLILRSAEGFGVINPRIPRERTSPLGQTQLEKFFNVTDTSRSGQAGRE